MCFGFQMIRIYLLNGLFQFWGHLKKEKENIFLKGCNASCDPKHRCRVIERLSGAQTHAPGVLPVWEAQVGAWIWSVWVGTLGPASITVYQTTSCPAPLSIAHSHNVLSLPQWRADSELPPPRRKQMSLHGCREAWIYGASGFLPRANSLPLL